MPQRATLEELKDFANKVREAGGGNPLDALMPAVPQNATQCLIARNLNFNCTVTKPEMDGPWEMFVEDKKVAQKIGAAVWGFYAEDKVEYHRAQFDTPECWSIDLPAEIGQVAADFDMADNMIDALSQAKDEWSNFLTTEDHNRWDNDFLAFAWNDFGGDLQMDYDAHDFDFDLIKEMWPYIEMSKEEVASIGIFDDEGNLIL